MTGFWRWAAFAAGVAALMEPEWQSVGSPASVSWKPALLVQLQVSDLDRSILFYTATLGFKLTERRDELRFAHGGNPPSPGSIALNFSVRGDIEISRRALEAKGVVFRGPTVVIPGKVRLAEFKDPFVAGALLGRATTRSFRPAPAPADGRSYMLLLQPGAIDPAATGAEARRVSEYAA